MCGKYSAASRRNRSRLMTGAGSPARYRGATRSSQARLYKAPTVFFTSGSRITKKRQRCMFPPLGAQIPASRILRMSSFGTGSGFSRRIDRVVRMISNRSMPSIALGMASPAGYWLSQACAMGSLRARSVARDPRIRRCRSGSPGEMLTIRSEKGMSDKTVPVAGN